MKEYSIEYSAHELQLIYEVISNLHNIHRMFHKKWNKTLNNMINS